MIIIEPHIHMTSRTTNDYERMYAAGIRACVEPSFWLGSSRRYAGSFFDHYQLNLEFEAVRAERFGIDHFACVSVNPKEADDLTLAREVLAGMGEYLDHPRCVAIGEIGFNNITHNEETIFRDQLAIAEERQMPVMIHLPHFHKPEGMERILAILQDYELQEEMVLIDHNTEETMPLGKDTGYRLGLTVYPISKLTPERVSEIVRQYGDERIMVNGSADWGVSDPLSLVKVVEYMRNDGHSDATIENLVFNTANAFYSHSPNWKPRLDLTPIDPHQFQR